MKVIIRCEYCNNEVELLQETDGNMSNVHPKIKESEFQVYKSEIEANVSADFGDEFIKKLADTKGFEQVENILHDEIEDNVDVSKELKSIRIDCTKCNDNITLENFE